jgi:hypothetical protein
MTPRRTAGGGASRVNGMAGAELFVLGALALLFVALLRRAPLEVLAACNASALRSLAAPEDVAAETVKSACS